MTDWRIVRVVYNVRCFHPMGAISGIQWASKYGHIEVVRLLLHADPADESLKSAIQHARKNRHGTSDRFYPTQGSVVSR